MTNELLMIMSAIFVVPILMSVLTLTLKYPTIRRVTPVPGTLFVGLDLPFLGPALFV